MDTNPTLWEGGKRRGRGMTAVREGEGREARMGKSEHKGMENGRRGREREEGGRKKVRATTVDEGDWVNVPVLTARRGVQDGGLPGPPRVERRSKVPKEGGGASRRKEGGK